MHSSQYRFVFLSAVIILALAGTPAASSTLDDLALMGEEAMRAGNYAEAIRHYERIIEIGPTYESLMAVQFDLGWGYYLTDQPEKAIPLFETLSSKRAPSEEVRQQSLFLLAECHARVASGHPEGSGERKKYANKAVELHSRFQKEYPKNPNIPQSLYGRGYAYYLDGEMQKAEADLTAVRSRHPGTQVARDATFLLASVYSSIGLELLQKEDEAGAEEYTEKARALFSDLAQLEGTNLGVANDSVFSLAETWFAAGEYLQAIRYYQQMRSKTEVARNIERMQEDLQRQLTREIREQEDTRMTRAAIDRIRAQAREVRREPDMMLSGYLRIADAFYRLERYDEMRTVCRHIAEFAEEENRQQAAYMIINSYLQENDVEAAVREFEDFQLTFGHDVPLVDTVAMSIGQLYLSQGDMEKALAFLDKSTREYPEGRSAEDALYLKLAAEYMDQKHEQTLETVTEYLDRYPDGNYAANALYYRAMSLASLRQWDEALPAINAVLERFPEGTEEFTQVDEAFYQKGWILNELKNYDEAVSHLKTFLAKFEDSALRPEATYQLGIALNGAGDPERSEAVLASIAEEFPDHRIAPPALFQIAVQYFEKDDYPGMEEALKVLVGAYPDSNLMPESHFWLGWIAMQDNRYDEAIEMLAKVLDIDPAHMFAPEAMRLMAQSYQGKAQAMGLPTVLGEERRAEYKATVLNAAETFQQLMVRYPRSSQMLDSVPGIADSIYDLLRYRQMEESEAMNYFKQAIARHADDPDAQSLLSYSMGSFLMKNREQEKALDAFKSALSINPDIRLSPVMLTQYAEALKEAGALEDAEAIYAKIIEDYADDPVVLAPAWYGLADVKYRKESYDEAKELFEKVLVEFEWYEEGRQGRVMLARILEQNEQYAEAEKMFEEVWRQETGAARLGAMLGVARTQLAQAAIAKKEGKTLEWKENIRVADQNLTRLIVLFEAYPESVAEALWLKGNAYELVGDTQKARETYSRLVLDEEYRNMRWTAKARERLAKLGGVLAPSP